MPKDKYELNACVECSCESKLWKWKSRLHFFLHAVCNEKFCCMLWLWYIWKMRLLSQLYKRFSIKVKGCFAYWICIEAAWQCFPQCSSLYCHTKGMKSIFIVAKYQKNNMFFDLLDLTTVLVAGSQGQPRHNGSSCVC